MKFHQFALPVTRNLYKYGLKGILFSFNQTYKTIFAYLGHVQVKTIRKTNFLLPWGPFLSFLGEILPFCFPRAHDYHRSEVKTVLFSSIQTYHAILVLLGPLKEHIMNKSHSFIFLGGRFNEFHHQFCPPFSFSISPELLLFCL